MYFVEQQYNPEYDTISFYLKHTEHEKFKLILTTVKTNKEQCSFISEFSKDEQDKNFLNCNLTIIIGHRTQKVCYRFDKDIIKTHEKGDRK